MITVLWTALVIHYAFGVNTSGERLRWMDLLVAASANGCQRRIWSMAFRIRPSFAPAAIPLKPKEFHFALRSVC